MAKILRSLFVFLGAAGASAVIGWWLSKRQATPKSPILSMSQPLMPVSPVPPPARLRAQITLPLEAFEDLEIELASGNSAGPSSTVLATAPPGTTDDLTQIKGIGPKMQEALAAVGVYRFNDLANMSAQGLKERLPAVRVSVSQLETWILAARELMAKP